MVKTQANQILELLEDWGSQSKFIWFRELHRITDIDKGIKVRQYPKEEHEDVEDHRDAEELRQQA